MNVELLLIGSNLEGRRVSGGALARHPLGHLGEVGGIAARSQATHDEPEGDDGEPGDDQNQEYRALRLPHAGSSGHDPPARLAGTTDRHDPLAVQAPDDILQPAQTT